MKNTLNKLFRSGVSFVGVIILMSFASGAALYFYSKGTHHYKGNIDATGNVYGENLHPRLLLNETYIEHPGNILFELPDGEQTGIHSAYGVSATRIADSDSLIALLKGDRTDLAYYYLSTDNGDSYTLIDTLWSTRADWYTDRMQEGLVFYENDTVFYYVKGRTGNAYAFGLFYSLRNDIATVYEYDNTPQLTDTAIGNDLGITVSDFSLSDLIYEDDSCKAVITVLDSATDVYSTYIFSGTDKTNLTVKHKMFNGRPSSLALGGSLMKDADSMYHILEDVETGNSRYITSRYARSLYGKWYEESGSFMQPSHSLTGWDNYGVKGGRILKANGSRLFPDTTGGYTQVYYSGDSVSLNVQRAGKVKMYLDYVRVDTALNYHDTSAQIVTRYYLGNNAALIGGQSVSADSFKIGSANAKPISIIYDGARVVGISKDATYIYYNFGTTDRYGYYNFRSSGPVYWNMVSGLQANGTAQRYGYIYGYLRNNTNSADLDNARITYWDCGDGTTKEGGIGIEGKNGSGWQTHAIHWIGKFSQQYAPYVFGGSDKDPYTYTPPSFVSVAGGDVEVTDSTKGFILKSPDGTRYRLTVPNGGASITITAL